MSYNSDSVPDMVQKPSRTARLDRIQRWCVEHTAVSMLAGFFLIFVGVMIPEIFDYAKPQSLVPIETSRNILYRIHWSSLFSHFFIISGEAIVVMFFLHLFVERLNAKSHENVIKSLVDSLNLNMQLEVSSLMKDFRKEANHTTEALKKDLFAAILHHNMPHEIVERVINSGFFKTSILRKDLVVTYNIKNDVKDVLTIDQAIEFKMSYESGSEQSFDYMMPFSLSDTPQVEYNFVNAGFRRGPALPFEERNERDHFKKREYGSSKEKDVFVLTDAISLQKNETLEVRQRFTARHKNLTGLMQDIYYVNQHSIDITITFKLPENFEVNLYPTFPEAMLPAPIKFSDQISYENIPFLVPGQGYMFSIKRQEFLQ